MAGHPTEINTPTPRTVSNIESSFPLIDQTKERIKTSEKYKIDWVFILLESRNVLFRNLKIQELEMVIHQCPMLL